MWSELDISKREVDQDLTYFDWGENVCPSRYTETIAVYTETELQQVKCQINR